MQSKSIDLDPSRPCKPHKMCDLTMPIVRLLERWIAHSFAHFSTNMPISTRNVPIDNQLILKYPELTPGLNLDKYAHLPANSLKFLSQ